MITYKYIKELVEDRTEIKDIGIKSRKTKFVDARCCYYKLCYLFVEDYTTITCAEFVNKDHSTLLNGLKSFEKYYNTNYFKFNDVYDECNGILRSIFKRSASIECQIKYFTDKIAEYQNELDNLIKELDINN